MKIVTQDNWKKGDRVVRGVDWCWNNQDCLGGKQRIGVVSRYRKKGWVTVKWGSARKYCYRVGANGRYDLQFYTERKDPLDLL